MAASGSSAVGFGMATVADLGKDTRGIWTRKQALAVLTPGQVDGFVRRHEWQVPWPGVYADAGFELDVHQRAHAASLASGRHAVVCGRLAARWYGLPLVDDDDPATGRREHLIDDVALPWHAADLAAVGRRAETRRLQRHQRRYDADAVTSVAGLRVTTPLQTVWDCAQLLRADALVCLIDAALHDTLVLTGDLRQLVEDRAWLPGIKAVRQAVALADGRSESPNETLGRLLLLPFLPGLVPQYRLRDRHGRVLARFDLAHPLARLAIEGDGKAGHAGARSAARDQRRDRSSDAYGWRTERYTWFEVRCRQDQLLRRVMDAARAQVRRHGLRIV